MDKSSYWPPGYGYYSMDGANAFSHASSIGPLLLSNLKLSQTMNKIIPAQRWTGYQFYGPGTYRAGTYRGYYDPDLQSNAKNQKSFTNWHHVTQIGEYID